MYISPHLMTLNIRPNLPHISHFFIWGGCYGVLHFKLNQSAYILLRIWSTATQCKEGNSLENESQKSRLKLVFRRLTLKKTLSNFVPFPLHLFSYYPFYANNLLQPIWSMYCSSSHGDLLVGQMKHCVPTSASLLIVSNSFPFFLLIHEEIHITFPCPLLPSSVIPLLCCPALPVLTTF